MLAALFLPVLSGSIVSQYADAPQSIPAKAQIGTVADRAAAAAQITSIAQNEARNFLRRAYAEPITQRDVSKHLEAIMRAEGADGPLAFATLTMSGPELKEPHGNPNDDYEHVINPATEPIVMIDMGCKYENHSADVTRTYFFESATQEMRDAYSAVLAAEEAAIAAISPGVTIGELDAIVRAELSDYIGVEGVSFYPYWGHGVGFYVHEYPTLYQGAGATKLQIGQVLALEPNLFFDDGWAVRVEDIVLVTSTGVEVLSEAPKTLENVTITQDDPIVSTAISISNYEYNRMVNVLIDLEDSTGRTALSVSFFDGRSWHTMTHLDEGDFSYSYMLLERLHSGFITAAFRLSFYQDTVYFTRDLIAAPSNTSEVTLNPSISFDSKGPVVIKAVAWDFNYDYAAMIRLHFISLSTNDGSQTLLTDSAGRVVEDIRFSDVRNFWSPWVAGDTARLSVNPISASGVSGVGFVVDRYEFAYLSDYTPTPTPPTSSTTTPTGPPSSPTPSPTTIPQPAGVMDLTLLIAGIAALAGLGIIFVIGRDLRS
ncbi:MAG: M24 family metallopeptidase [Candidatus Thorarchaeota archaeon]